METGSLTGFFDFMNRAGVLGLLIWAMVGGYREWWVWGWQYRQVVKDRDEWKALALKSTSLTTRLADQHLPSERPNIE